jgi:hypothetical protein
MFFQNVGANISNTRQSSVTSLIGVSKSFAVTCFGHYWPLSEDITNAIKKTTLHMLFERKLLL